MRAWVLRVHAGEASDFILQAVAGLVSLAAVILVWTALAFCWRTWPSWVTRRRRVDTPRVEALSDERG